jgi:SAM-dependent methyltransferase
VNTKSDSKYDDFAWFYNKYWGNFNINLFKYIRKYMLEIVPANGNILDLCCGTGQLAMRLNKLGYKVTGVDISPDMIRLARKNAPEVDFIISDIREYNSIKKYDGVLSVFDSLNHILDIEGLERVFCNVNKVLVENGVFIFDMLMEKGFSTKWTGGSNKVTDEYVYVDNSSFDSINKIGIHNFTIFNYHNLRWERIDAQIKEKCYSINEVYTSLSNAGFSDIAHFECFNDLKIPNQEGRSLFVVKK